MITLIGVLLVGKTLWVADHQHSRDGKMLAIATGLIPCPLTTFILTYALVKQKLAVGLAAVGGMLAGVIVTLVSFAVAAVLARSRLMSLLSRQNNGALVLGGGSNLLAPSQFYCWVPQCWPTGSSKRNTPQPVHRCSTGRAHNIGQVVSLSALN